MYPIRFRIGLPACNLRDEALHGPRPDIGQHDIAPVIHVTGYLRLHDVTRSSETKSESTFTPTLA